MLAITAPTAIWVGSQLLDRLLGLGHRHVLQQGDQVHHGGVGPQHALIESAWLRIGPTLASPETASWMLRNWAIRPVGGASSTTASYASSSPLVWRRTASYTLPVSSTSRRPGAIEVAKSIGAELVQGLAGQTEVVEGLQVLQQRVLGVDRQPVHGAAARGAASVRRSSAPSSGGRPNRSVMPCRPSTSHTSTRRPAWPARRPARRRSWSCRCRPCR